MTTATEVRTFAAHETARLAGITYRQLDYWCRVHLVWPSVRDANGSGSRRRFSADDVRLIALLGVLRGRAVGTADLAALVPVVSMWHSGLLVAAPLIAITDRGRVYPATTADDLLEVLLAAEGPVTVVKVPEVDLPER